MDTVLKCKGPYTVDLISGVLTSICISNKSTITEIISELPDKLTVVKQTLQSASLI